MKHDLVNGPLLKESLLFGLPLALGTATHALFNLVDLKMVGFLGQDAVAAIHVGSIVNFIPMVVANGISVGSVAMISRYFGSGAWERAKEVSNRAIIGLFFLGIILGIIGFLAAEPLVRFQNAEREAFRLGVVYLKILSAGTFTMFVLLQVTASLRAIGDAVRPVLLLAGANILNLLLDLILIFGWDFLGIPAMGVAGAAWGTVIARFVGACTGIWFLYREECPVRISSITFWGLVEEAKQLLRIGLPQSTQMLGRILAVIYLTRLAAEMGGGDALAAVSVGVRMDMVLFFAAAGWGSAAQAMVGQNMGAKKIRRCIKAGTLLSFFASTTGAILVVVYAVFAEGILRFFIENPSNSAIEQGVLYFRVAVLSYPFAAIALTIASAINGAGITFSPMVIDLVGFLGFLVPLTSLLSTVFSGSYDLSLLWWTVVGFNVVMALVYLYFFQKMRWFKGRWQAR